MLSRPVDLELHSKVPVDIPYLILGFILKGSRENDGRKLTQHGQTAGWFCSPETAWD